jgi:hypothetical protein
MQQGRTTFASCLRKHLQQKNLNNHNDAKPVIRRMHNILIRDDFAESVKRATDPARRPPPRLRRPSHAAAVGQPSCT